MVRKTYLLGAFCVLVSAVLFGIQPIFGAQLQSFDVDPLALNTIRYGVPAAFLLLISERVGTTLNLGYVLRHGWLDLGFAGAGLGYYKAGYGIGFGFAVILFFSFLLFVSLYSASILRIKTSAIQTVTMLTSLLGLVIAVGVGHLEINSLSGAGWAFFCRLLCQCFTSSGTRRTTRRRVSLTYRVDGHRQSGTTPDCMDHRRTVPNRYAVLELSYWAIGLLGYWAIGLLGWPLCLD